MYAPCVSLSSISCVNRLPPGVISRLSALARTGHFCGLAGGDPAGLCTNAGFVYQCAAPPRGPANWAPRGVFEPTRVARCYRVLFRLRKMR